ncbi:MAG: M28 family peptidase [candidate division Zixibacteria bacterium]|nr:M28 family peptidase [candidate division Zixibacteria bacterium]
MIKTASIILAAILLLSTPLYSNTENPNQIRGDLYKVTISSKIEADKLRALEVEPVIRLNDGYMVIAEQEAVSELLSSGLKSELISRDISRDELAVDNRMDRKNVDLFELLYEVDQLRIFRIDPDEVARMEPAPQISRILVEDMKIIYKGPPPLKISSAKDMVDLETLIANINRDSLESYTERLQAFTHRDATTDSNIASGYWLYSKFEEFGYDSVTLDTFSAPIFTLADTCFNVVAFKVGSVLPDHHVIVGAHRDAVPLSPGADDNGSGTAAVLEIARILKDVDTYCTIVFALFDAEENGLIGSSAYADEAADNGDSIILMLNMDMIAEDDNRAKANLFHGSDMTYPNLWADLADSLVGITTTFQGASGNSDHYPFLQNGYDAFFSHEYEFSDVYHSPQDSTTYMNFTYMRVMTQASLATAYVVAKSYAPFALVFDYPSGIPVFIEPGGAATFQVSIEGITGGVMVPGSAELHYAIGQGNYTSIPMTEISPGLYEGVFPELPCFGRINFFVTAEEEINGVFYDTDPSEPHEAVVIEERATLFYDDFELDNGWTVYGDAEEGAWERGIPIGGGDRGDPPTDYDGSGNCFLTYNMDGNSDVDFGTTNLVSPSFDLSTGNGEVSYTRWYSNHLGYIQDDVMNVYISNNNGSDWTLVETVGPTGPGTIGGWITKTFWAGDFVEASDQIKLRFEVSDLNMSSTVEAGIDSVHVTSLICESGYICGDVNSDLSVNVSDAVFVINYVFIGGVPPEPIFVGDTNCDGAVNVSDGVYIINYVFIGGHAPCDPNGNGLPDCG